VINPELSMEIEGVAYETLATETETLEG